MTEFSLFELSMMFCCVLSTVLQLKKTSNCVFPPQVGVACVQ